MNKYTRSYPATLEYKKRIYKPSFYYFNIAVGVVVAVLLLLALNYTLSHL
jgi:hypothetical protein